MTAKELRKKYIDFFVSKGHTHIPSASLIPEYDPTVLFTTAGMHPLVPYLMGEKHPAGKRLTNIQKCIRTSDIDEVGDNRHLTFFEMMGNWSFGDYFKKEAIEWSWEFLTEKKWLGLDPKRIYITVFKGEKDLANKDTETINYWQMQFEKAKIKAEISNEAGNWTSQGVRIFLLGKEDNWWGPAGASGPCGPCTEMFYDTKPERGFEKEKNFNQMVEEERFLEIWNDVFMEFNKTVEGKFEPLKQKNVDTGMGVERTITVLNGFDNVFETEFFVPIIKKIEEICGKKYLDNQPAFRIIADHLKAATFILGDEKGVTPSNVDQGYVLRRLIRRAIRYGKHLGIRDIFTFKIAESVIEMYNNVYPEVKKNKEFIINQLILEEEKFNKTIEKGLKIFNKQLQAHTKKPDKPVTIQTVELIDSVPNFIPSQITGEWLFDMYQTFGFPFELSIEELRNQNIFLDEFEIKNLKKEFDTALSRHQELSRTASAGKFKGGLADAKEETIKLHTAAHLMLAALRKVLGPNVYQKGSNITPERLRFDFSYDKKMTPEQIKQVEDLVNKKIQEKIPVECKEMDTKKAQEEGAMGVFGHKYGEKVKVYSISDFSKEICGGPHVKNTAELGHFKIIKEESSSAGVRRIKAILE
jgi:alanyl-tRNA synthetase